MSKTECSDGSRLIAAQQEMGDALLLFARRSFLRAFATNTQAAADQLLVAVFLRLPLAAAGESVWEQPPRGEGEELAKI